MSNICIMKFNITIDLSVIENIKSKGMISMDSTGWFIIFLVIGIAVLAIYLYKQSASKSTPPTPVSDPEKTPPTPAPVRKEPPKYISIYEYRSTQTVRKCACCDGENPYGTKVCSICGNDFDR